MAMTWLKNAWGQAVGWFLAVVTMLFYALCLCGCISTTLEKLYIIEIVPAGSAGTLKSGKGPSVKVGYFGTCISNGAMDKKVNCKPTTAIKPKALDPTLRNALKFGSSLQANIFLYPLVGAGVLFVIGLIFLLILKLRGNPKGTKTADTVIKWLFMFFGGSSLGLALASALGVTQTGPALAFVTKHYHTPYLIVGGTYLKIFQWVITALSFAVMFCASIFCDGGGGGGGGGAPPLGDPLAVI